LFEKLLNTSCYKTESVATEGVTTAFFKTGESKIELLESMDADGVIARFIEKKGEGMHHIALQVEDIYAEMSRLKGEGFLFLQDEPKLGADNKLICFLHPKCTNGVLTELCQEIKT
jgi:methylmalonyl-CoA/ethylmalonyl-CoA epimerase